MKYLSVTRARASFLRLVDNLQERTAIMRNGQPVAVLLDFDDYRGLVAAQALGRDSERLTEVRNIANRFSEGHLEGFQEVEILTSDAIAAGRTAYARARRHVGIEIGPHQRRATDVPARQPEKTRAGDT